ncbi:MAG: transglycosylase SLT domain-containing protein [Deltaproteobacteria bacterium]|nr:transglycosylase SLT domain-containing protein [Deltaproteobacteria bacterium]MBW1928058.1 transglycosylase SLT domain-containing protein [Deltaproteobacteria bacterium]MBW2024953.1 transglycosylase SLT domain-containing protein [Deltaproteobacteria bacterium]MBW2126674.1 transglycosylase SLT domain-containing protein [Deltaproteobacteria bacterium]RLB15879.1 MAG: lytic transglycosylase [Deltaproteobacteria bacterium]
MQWPKFRRCSAAVALLMVLVPGVTQGDIYRFKDENGVWHFTNVKDDARYRLYIRTRKTTSKAYIKKYEGIIRQAAEQFHVDPLLIKAVIKAESDFDHRAVSHKGAQGLMQLMPDTANELKVEDPFDPEENIYGGTRYLSRLLRRFHNDKERAIAAYNAGPELVEQSGGIPPVPETRRFVEKVMQYYRQFRQVR